MFIVKFLYLLICLHCFTFTVKKTKTKKNKQYNWHKCIGALAKPKQTLYSASPFHVQEAIILFVLPQTQDKTTLHNYPSLGTKGGMVAS